jgi:cell division protein FtsI/penicillin-binding protein 2
VGSSGGVRAAHAGVDATSRVGRVSRANRATVLVALGVTLVFGVVLARVAQLKLTPSEALALQVAKRESGRRVAAASGDLLDRRGRVLATSRFVYQCIVDPTLLPEPPDPAFTSIAGALGVEADQIGETVLRAIAANEEIGIVRAAAGFGPKGEPEPRPVTQMVKARLGLSEATEDAEEAEPAGLPKLKRYVAVGPMIEPELADRVRALRIPGVSIERRERREYPGGEVVASIVGQAGVDDPQISEAGWLGMERRFEGELEGDDGQLRYVRDAWGRPLWVGRGKWQDPQRGGDVRLSMDLEIQRIAIEELERGVRDADAAGGRIVVVDPHTGEVLAMADVMREVPGAAEFPWLVKDQASGKWTAPNGLLPADPADRPRYRVLKPDPKRAVHAALGRNRCVEDVYEPGSTFKSFIWAEGRALNLIGDSEVLSQPVNLYVTPYGRPLKDTTFRTELTWDQVLLYSSNIGMTRLSERMTPAQMQAVLRRLRFGQRTNLGLSGESPGIVTTAKNWTVYSQTSVAIGQEIAVTPVQMARAFCAIARTGDDAGTMPALRLTAAGEDDRRGLVGQPVTAERVFPAEVAEHVRTALAGVADRMDALMERRFKDEHGEPRYTMFGKSGTADIPCSAPRGLRRPPGSSGYYDNQYNSSFLAAAPSPEPRIVVLVVIDDPGPALVRRKEHYGSWVAGPVVRRVVERTLPYLGVAPDVRESEEAVAAASN